MSALPPRSRGRPVKELRPQTNHADMDAEMLAQLRSSIAALVRQGKFSSAFSDIDVKAVHLLAEKLAYEIAAYPAVAGLVNDSTGYYPPLRKVVRVMALGGIVRTQVPPLRITRAGPKPKIAHIVFATTVRDLLAEAGVSFRQWDNGRNRRDDMLDFLKALGALGNIRHLAISDRSFDMLTESGFVG